MEINKLKTMKEQVTDLILSIKEEGITSILESESLKALVTEKLEETEMDNKKFRIKSDESIVLKSENEYKEMSIEELDMVSAGQSPAKKNRGGLAKVKNSNKKE